jgi:hypothetical protein
VVACWMLWLSGWETACAEEFGSNGVAFTGASDAAPVVAPVAAPVVTPVAVTAAGARSPEAAVEAAEALENDGPLANDRADNDNAGAASPTELTRPLWTPSRDWPCGSST